MNRVSRSIFLLLLLVFGVANVAISFHNGAIINQDTIYSFMDVEETPEPEIGMAELYKKWSAGIKYPAEARKNGIEGRVFIYFVVDKAGEIIDTGIERGIGHGCDDAALEAFKKTKLKWKPGIKDGQNVKVRMVMPFVFKLG